ncbi:PAN domain-containing protein [Rhodobacter xanthinilyticus]|uniref:PAN domain-containing protein n=1 Tax=Rhodobacter xanthinilyticus TaxID=1850250 RepID=A0A1D9MES2_9RHOB|nr:alpha-2-macroglobulin family protein [Rhodobacter xanthinilyticus]AOZ70357.1 PAN domain-containing protein [Rhodobacter xanthinilyticus]
MRILGLILAFTLTAGPVLADTALIPERRMVYSEGMDLAGRDLAQIFDTTLEGCESACLARRDCEAVVFNARNNSCFPKADLREATPYQGAFAGVVKAAAPGAVARAAARAADLAFLTGAELTMAHDQARGLGRAHMTGDWSADELSAALAAARKARDAGQVERLTGALLALSDSSELWLDYARAILVRGGEGAATRAVAAAVNGYLRAPAKPAQAEAAYALSQALARENDHRGELGALRLAGGLSARADIAEALAAAEAKYGFRIVENTVEADLASPRVCAQFSEPLDKAGDYARFVQLPAPGLAVEAEENQLCVAGLEHGARVSLTFRAGLPSRAGETLAKDVTITSYIRDRSPAVRFPGRAYILPRAQDAGLPVETVNVEHLDVRLLRVSDRNLVAAMRRDYFARSLDTWAAEDLSDSLAEEVWSGTADVAMEVNRDVLTRLPVQEVTGPLGAGVYVLQASVPGQDPYDHPPAAQWFVISDLGMTSFAGVDGLTVALRGLSDAGPRGGAMVELVSRANSVLGRAQTDAKGVAHFPADLTSGRGGAAPAMISAVDGEDMAFLSLTEAEFDLSDRGVEGAPPAPPIDVYLTTDRGAYRAGEQVFATILARDGASKGLAGVPLTAVLMRPDGVEYGRQLTEEVGAGGHVARFVLGGEAPRGTWRIEVYADPKAPALASERLLVEDFLPERIDFALSLPEGLLAGGSVPELGVEARYLYGAPGAGLAIEGEVTLSEAGDLPGWAGYRFGRHDAGFAPISEPVDGGETDESGHATVYAALPDAAEAGAVPLAARFTLRLSEASGRPVEREITRIRMPETPVIGIKPLFESLGEGDEARFGLIVLGPDGAPQTAGLSWRLNRIETRYQWYQLYGSWDWDAVTVRKRVAEGKAATGAKPAEIAAPVGWGEYELVVSDADGRESAVRFDAGWFAPADVLASPDRLELALDKAGYRAGEEAELRLVAPAEGVALVSVLSNRVISLQSVKIEAGENRITLPVTEEWGTGAYVTASVLRPMKGTAPERAPVRALGLAHAAVDPGARKLGVSIEAPEASEPRADLVARLRVEGLAPGETAFATVAATDLGILNLTGFAPPDPQGHYFGQRRLGVALRDLYGRLIDGQNGNLGALRSGGDAGRGMSLKAPPPTEELVAYFSGPVVVGEDGTAELRFPMPAFNGTVRLAAVAWSDTAVGQASREVLVRDPVVVSAALPRYLAPGDRSRLLLDLTRTEGAAGPAELSVTGAAFGLAGGAEQVALAPGQRVEISLPLAAPKGPAPEAGISVALTLPDGRKLTKPLALPVGSAAPKTMRQSRFDLAPGATFTFDTNVFAGFTPGSATALLTAGPMGQFNVPGLMAALDGYPYGCTEQVTSKALPLLYLSAVAEAAGLATPADLPAKIESAIAQVLANQDAGGAFGLWAPESGDFWLDAYVTDFLARAKAAGYAVPDLALRAAMDNLRNQVNYAPEFTAEENGGGVALAYALMVLAREGAASISDLRYYADVKPDDFATPLAVAQIGAALASYGDQARADAMFARAAERLRQTAPTGWRDDYGSDLRDSAGVLALASAAGSRAVPVEALGASLASRIAAVPLSTQEAAWVLLAAQAGLSGGDAGLSLDGQPLTRPVLRLDDQGATGARVIANTSARPVTLTLTTTGLPEVAEPAGGKGFTVTRSLYTLEGEPVDAAHIAQGARLVAVVEVVPHGPTESRLMIADPLPAGFEIDNPNLLRAGDIAALDWLSVEENTRMVEFRQDRFLAALDWRSDAPFRLAYILRAVSPGEFARPAASVEDMYRPDLRAWSETGRVVIE